MFSIDKIGLAVAVLPLAEYFEKLIYKTNLQVGSLFKMFKKSQEQFTDPELREQLVDFLELQTQIRALPVEPVEQLEALRETLLNFGSLRDWTA